MLNWKIHKMVFIIQIWRLTVLTFQIYMDGSILAFLKCMDTSVRTYLNGSVWSHLRFSNNLLTLDLHSLKISVYHSYYARKATKLPIWNIMLLHNLFLEEDNSIRDVQVTSQLASRFICLWYNQDQVIIFGLTDYWLKKKQRVNELQTGGQID